MGHMAHLPVYSLERKSIGTGWLLRTRDLTSRCLLLMLLLLLLPFQYLTFLSQNYFFLHDPMILSIYVGWARHLCVPPTSTATQDPQLANGHTQSSSRTT